MRGRDILILEHLIGQKCINAPKYEMINQDYFRDSLKIYNFQSIAFIVNCPARQQFVHSLLSPSSHPFHSLFLLSPSSFQPSLHPPSLLSMTFSDIYPPLLWHGKNPQPPAQEKRLTNKIGHDRKTAYLRSDKTKHQSLRGKKRENKHGSMHRALLPVVCILLMVRKCSPPGRHHRLYFFLIAFVAVNKKKNSLSTSFF